MGSMDSMIQTTAGSVRIAAQETYDYCMWQRDAVQQDLNEARVRYATLPWWRKWWEGNPDARWRDYKSAWRYWNSQAERAQAILESVSDYLDEATVLLTMRDRGSCTGERRRSKAHDRQAQDPRR